MKVLQITAPGSEFILPAARILMETFVDISPDSWPDMKTAERTVRACLEPGRVVIAAYDGDVLTGWTGARPNYGITGWELHPIVVDVPYQGKGIGASLLRRLESEVKLLGGITLFLGADDETGRTSLSGKNLYDNLWKEIDGIKNLAGHPYEFYIKNGYIIVGVIPDANGIGKPDILMAKRLL
ncbi:MAG: GNAT family N-acetyltransferase [Brevinematales bacterium]|nr:GNAT family N-acetyltransferase [Brevinematales bacterium]